MKKINKNRLHFSTERKNKRTRFVKIAVLMSLLFAINTFYSLAFSQTTVTGKVLDSKTNESIPGANILIEGTNQGTVTDIDGKFSLKVPKPTTTLLISFIGYKSQKVQLNSRTTLEIALEIDATDLEGLVVIGYGSVKKSDLTGSISVVSTKELTKNPSSGAAQALQGKAAGVVVTQSGQPGGSSSIRVRGVGSINSGADPIYILDGVRVGGIDGIQPQDIESMQVLKDASATAIYGANGSNGVIIVTTKRGKSGKPQVNFNSYVSYNLAPKKYDVMNADQYSAFYAELRGALPEYGQPFREKYYGDGWQEGTNWQDEIFHNGMASNYNLSVAGGGDKSNYSVIFGYTKDNGTVIKSNFERYSIRANSDFSLSRFVKLGENFSINYSDGEDPITVQSSIWDLNASPLMKIHNPNLKGGYETYQAHYWQDADGNLVYGDTPTGYTGPVYTNTLRNDKPNPIAAPLMGSNKYYNLGTSASVYLQLDFTDWLTYKITPTAMIDYGRGKYWLPGAEENRLSKEASLSENYYENITLNLEQQVSFKKSFNNIHNVQATAVYLLRGGQSNSANPAKNGYDFEQLNTLGNGGTSSESIKGYTSESRERSYLGRIMYDYKGIYYATASYRSDGSYVFAPGSYRRGDFFSTSVAWKINEVFFKDVKEIDALKLRVGWGQTGNSKIGGGFQYVDQISEASNFSPVFGADQQIARAQYAFYGYPSYDIHWETSEMSNIGIDASLFKNKLQASIEYYIKNTKDLLNKVKISSAYGRVAADPWSNIGDLQNRGIEMSLQWRDNVGEFSYGIISNFTTIKNEVKYLPSSDITQGNNRTIVGHSIGALYGFVSDGIIQLDESNYAKGADGNWQIDEGTGLYKGYKHATYKTNYTPQPGDIKYSDLNGDGNVDAYDRTLIGKTIPSLTYSIGFDCAYKNFDFNIFLYGVNGFDIFNQQRASLSGMNSQDMDHNKLNDWVQNHWTLENASTSYVRVDDANTNNNDQMSSFWVEDGSFLRIKDVQFGYNIPKDRCKEIGLASFRIYASASNLYCFTKYKGRDPEGFMSIDPLNSGTDSGNYTIPRSFIGGLQLGF